MTNERIKEIVDAVLATDSFGSANARLGRDKSYIRSMCRANPALRDAIKRGLARAGRKWPRAGRPETTRVSGFNPIDIDGAIAALENLRRIRQEWSVA